MRKTLQMLLLCMIVSSAAIAQKTNNVQIIELNAQTFKQKVWNFDKDKSFKRVGNLPIILDFHATWCGPCKMLAPHLQAIQNKYNGKLIVYKIDVDQEPALAQRFNVQAMPTIVFMATKEKYKSELGYRDYNEFEKLVQTYFFSK
jgi:thioredoxin 1